MMAPVLPLELLQTLDREVPFRGPQLRQLATLFNPAFPTPSTLVLHGLEGTGKTKAIIAVLEARAYRYVMVKCRHCLSQRHLLAMIFAALSASTVLSQQSDQYDKLDCINSLATCLQRLLRDSDEKVAIILDGIEQLRGAGVTLLPALARLGDIVPNLSVVLVSNSYRQLTLQKPGVPVIHFNPYSCIEAISLVRSSVPALPSSLEQASTSEKESLSKIYSQFVAAVYDSLVAHTSSTSITVFKSTCHKLWPRFINPITSQQPAPSNSQRWTFAHLMVASRQLFQSEGESALIDHLAAPITQQHNPAYRSTETRPPLLKHFASILLVAAYLASNTQPKFDIVLFSRLSSGSKRLKATRRKLAQFKSPSKTKLVSGTATPTKRNRSTLPFDPKLGVARPFTVERLTAILRAIHPHGVSGNRGIADRVYRELAELERLRLVTCVGGGGGTGGDDPEERRWRVRVGRGTVDGLARRWGFPSMRDYEVDLER